MYSVYFCLLSFTVAQQFAEIQSWYTFKGQKYLIVKSKTTFSYSDAQSRCIQRGAHLADVKTQELLNQLVTKIGNNTGYPHSFYLSGTRDTDTNIFRWSDNTAIDGNLWEVGQPDNLGYIEDCVMLGFKSSFNRHFALHDVRCTGYPSHYICKRDQQVNTAEQINVSTTKTPMNREFVSEFSATSLSTRNAMNATSPNLVYTIALAPWVIVLLCIVALLTGTSLAMTTMCLIRKKKKTLATNLTKDEAETGYEVPIPEQQQHDYHYITSVSSAIPFYSSYVHPINSLPEDVDYLEITG